MSHKRHYLRALAGWSLTLGLPRRKTFQLGPGVYPYFTHRYNFTWLNERSVEIPLMRQVLEQRAEAHVLEVGHVLGHYDPARRHDVVDKYEVSAYPALYREDALGFRGKAPYDLIISISTLEHVGWDESPRDSTKVGRTIRHLQSLLSPGGRFFFTVPVGYNPGLDAFLDDGSAIVRRQCLRRISLRNEWREVDWSEARTAHFHHPYPFANALVFAELGPLST